MADFLTRGNLVDVDPRVHELIQLESERQYRKLILIPSESTAPLAVRETLGSIFQNLYAEGYPDEETRWMDEEEILDYTARLTHFRRYSDPRYYKGVEYADIVESLARRRCAEVYANEFFSADQIFVNVQPLSGAPANNAVYHALINPGDTIMGMNLLHGGHLTHGSSVNRSGKLYNVVHYNVNPQTEKIDYDTVEALALENKPKIIIAGYSSYPWVPDWVRFREIADKSGAIVLADVSHIAGLIAGGAVPNPIGIAQVISFTTHKTLLGPRSAVIMTTDPALARKIDRAVFPGEQGGPHIHAIAALAVALKIAKTDTFRNLQHQIIANCKTLTERLANRGLRITYGGSDTHLGNVDCKTIIGADGTPLSGDLAARILDVAGIVLNRNTLPGDKTALAASGIRYGTPWVTQRGLGALEMGKLADVMADLLFATSPYSISSRKGEAIRAKVNFEVLEEAKLRIRELAEGAGFDSEITRHGYPHYFFIDDKPRTNSDLVTYDIKGDKVRAFVNYTFSSDTEELTPGQSQNSGLYVASEKVPGILTCLDPHHFQFQLPSASAGKAITWLRELSDGYTIFDDDLSKRIPGPIYISEVENPSTPTPLIAQKQVAKPYYIGIRNDFIGHPLPEFTWEETEPNRLRRTPLFETHKKLGAKVIPFAGWEMPVWYTSVMDEHLATRQAAGLFDVAHMGVYQAEGPDAAIFLDSVCGNDIGGLEVGESCYTHFLDQDANVIDDLLVYRREAEKFLLVVNASNDDKDWAWLNAVRGGKVMIDRRQPWALAFGRNVVLRNLRDPKEGTDRRVDIALQGQKSRDILFSLGTDPSTRRKITGLKRTELCEGLVGGIDLIISRTGYTGEKMAYELFVHPDQAVTLWDALLKVGEPYGLKPCGLGARDSLRTEAGLPLYGHEMGGELNFGVAEAGFANYVKTYKPWFIGREPFLHREKGRKGEVVRFRFTEKGVRMAHPKDPLIDRKGRVVGMVTSCAIDSEGFLTGQAFIEVNSSQEGTPLFIYQSASSAMGKPPTELKIGDRVVLPSVAVIISRFPK